MHHRLLSKNTRSICDQISVDLTARAPRVDTWAGGLYAVVTGFKMSITPHPTNRISEVGMVPYGIDIACPIRSGWTGFAVRQLSFKYTMSGSVGQMLPRIPPPPGVPQSPCRRREKVPKHLHRDYRRLQARRLVSNRFLR
jgi:hypothetical protein